MKKGLLVLFIGLVISSVSIGQISIGALPYNPGTTNFNSYNPNSAGNLTATIPTGWTAATTGTAFYNGQGNATVTPINGYWAFGNAGEYCLASVPSGLANNITYTVSFVNNSGSTITSLSLSWDYEQWSFGANSNIACTGTGALAANATLNAQDFTNVAGVNGSVNSTTISISLTGLSITNGTAFGIQWVASNAGSAAGDNGIGIDNFSIVASRTDNTDYFRSRQTGNLATTTTWQSSKDAIIWVSSSLAPDNNANTITILSGHTVTAAASVSVDQLTINSGGQVSVNAGQILTIANGAGTDLSVDGTLYNAGTITTTGTLAINAGGIYQHAQNGGTVPTATWSTTSTCNITGITSTAPSGLTQSFGNFTWDCAGHSNLIELNSTLTTINGDFTVRSAGQTMGNGRTQNGLALATNTNLTLNVGGNLSVEHNSSNATWLIMAYGTANVTLNITGNFNMSLAGSGTCFFDYKINTGTSMGTLVVNVGGNLTMTGGYLDMAYQASGYTVGTELRLSGNLSVSATSAFISSGANLVNGKVIFNKAGTQTIYEGAAGRIVYTNFQVNSGSTTEFLSNIYLYDYITAIKSGNFTVLSGSILDMNTYILHGYNVASGQLNVVNTYTSFTLNSDAGFITANANGVHRIGFTNGSISAAIATRTFNSGANYTYDGVILQNSGTFVTTPVANQVNNLTINNTTGINTTGVTLEQEFKVANTCTFISGVFTTTDVNVLTINDNATIVGADLSVGSNKYVNGPLKKIGNDAFTFPVGKASHGCRPVYISAPGNTTDQFRAELIRGNAGLLGPVTAVGLARVSGCEYWYIDRLVGSSNVNLTLSWSGESPCNAQSYVTDLPNLVVAHFNNTSWDSYGSNGYAGNAVSGTVTWNYIGPYNVTPIHTPWSLGSLVWYENPLTVKFVNLRASEKDGQVKVEWANIAETGVDKYFVEYSIDGRSFDEINNGTARKNDGKRTDYSWWHMTPTSGANYYRIKAIEFTGAVTYSQVVRLDLNKSNSDLIVYPNPVKGNNVSIAASGLAAGKYDIIVLNMSGQKIVQRSLDHAGGSVSMQVDLPETIKAGLYSIKLSGSEKTLVKTFIVQ